MREFTAGFRTCLHQVRPGEKSKSLAGLEDVYRFLLQNGVYPATQLCWRCGAAWSATWREYLALLDAEHAALKEAVAEAPWSALTRGPGGGRKTPAQHVYGAALHDVHHAGQIQVIKGIYKQRGG